MKATELHSTLSLLAVAVWFVVPALLVARLPRFRVVAGTLSFWFLGAVYYGVVSPPDSPLSPVEGWLVLGWLHGFVYALLVQRIHTKLQPSRGPIFNSRGEPHDNTRNA